jgi:hypothetical protein
MIIIDIESQEVMTTISMETDIYGMAVRGRTIYMAGDSSVTIIWACLSFFLRKAISPGFDSTTTLPNL